MHRGKILAIEINFSELVLLTNKAEESVRTLVGTGADVVELMLDGIQWDAMDQKVEELKKAFKDQKVEFTVHPPGA